MTNTGLKQDMLKKRNIKKEKQQKKKERTMSEGDCKFTTQMSSKENKTQDPKISTLSYLLQRLSKNTQNF